MDPEVEEIKARSANALVEGHAAGVVVEDGGEDVGRFESAPEEGAAGLSRGKGRKDLAVVLVRKAGGFAGGVDLLAIGGIIHLHQVLSICVRRILAV